MKLLQIIFWLSLLLGLSGIIGIGWYFANQILIPKPYSLFPEFEIIDTRDSVVYLPVPKNNAQFSATRKKGEYGLLWDSGYGRLGEVIAEDSGQISRQLSLLEGDLPIAGEPARLDSVLFHNDPEKDHAISFEDLSLSGPVGKVRAWWIEQHPSKAIVLIHGRRRGNLTETLRIMPKLASMGYSILAMSYRNHDQSAASPDGFYHYADSEWQDVVVGLEFLAEKGIEEIVLYGFSMGGAVALETLENHVSSRLKPIALIMDSPLLDPPTVFRNGAKSLGLPFSDQVTNLALMIAKFRAGIEWQNVDQRINAHTIGLPVFLIAGTGDSTIPISLVDEFASRVPDLEYRRLEGVEHVEGWNQNPQAYEGWIERFLQKYLPL